MPDTKRKSAASVAVWLVLFAAAATFALTMGTRQSMALFLGPLNTSTGLGLAQISLAFAFGQLWWGITQPIAGALADRYGAGPVLYAGVILIAFGIAITPMMTTTLGLILSIGVFAAGGAGMAGPAVLMGAAARQIPAAKHGIAFGVINAGGSIGQFIMAPIAAALLVHMGWFSAMQVVGLLVLLVLPATFVMQGRDATSAPADSKPKTSAAEAIRLAFGMPSYLMLGAGFFVCGFHVSFLITHLPGVVELCGLPPDYGGWSLGILGLFNVLGSLAIGWAMSRWRLKSLLSLLYAARGLAVLAFVMAPKTGTTVLIFSAVMGVTFLSTVPPTAGLVTKFFGPANMATLFGMIMLSHQVGGFFGAWIGGWSFDLVGHYDWVWYIDIVLAAAAALVHLPIKEPVPVPATAAA